MDDLLERVRVTGLLAERRPVVVLLSGGRDSVCLADCAARLSGAGVVVALHVNYGLRPEAAGDEEHCRALCERLGIALEVERAARPADAGNVQAWARDVRLGAGTRLATTRGRALATGHTATDQAETVLYRLAASPGRRALLGMAPRDGLLVRPLLGCTRDETAAHCAARGLAWREDASNTDAGFARARVREGLLPALRAVHPAAEASVVRTAALLREEAEVLDGLVDDALDAEGDRIALDRLAGLPRALGRLVLRRLAEETTGGLCPRASGRLDEVLGLTDGGALDLGEGARAVVSERVLRVGRTPPLPRGPG